MTQSPTGDCLYVFEDEAFESWVDSLFAQNGGYQSNNVQHAKMRKILNSRANDVAIDSAGRIGLPAGQRQIAGLDKDVVLVGDSDHFEVWDAQAWNDFCDGVDLSALFTG